MKHSPIVAVTAALTALALPACHSHKDEHAHAEHHNIVVTSPKVKDIVLTQQYVCQIHSQRHIKVCALENGYLEPITVKEGQGVKQGDVLFKVVPTLYQARLEAESAEADLAQLELNNTKKLFADKVVSVNEVMLYEAKLAKAVAKKKLAQAEVNFTSVKAPFDGLIDTLRQQQGSLVKEGEELTTLSDNSVMWVYFNVPEARYLEYMAGQAKGKGKNTGADHDRAKADADPVIELVLANGETFPHPGKIGAIEGEFNNETGNIPFRADFANPDRLLRHGQTGTVLIRRTQKNAVVIPQRATIEILDKHYVFVVDGHNHVRQKEVVVQSEMDDVFVIKSGVTAKDKIVLDGVRQVRDGDHVEEYETKSADEALANQKHDAE